MTLTFLGTAKLGKDEKRRAERGNEDLWRPYHEGNHRAHGPGLSGRQWAGYTGVALFPTHLALFLYAGNFKTAMRFCLFSSGVSPNSFESGGGKKKTFQLWIHFRKSVTLILSVW